MRKLTRLSDCPFGTIIYYSEHGKESGIVVRNKNYVVVEHSNGKASVYENTKLVYKEETDV